MRRILTTFALLAGFASQASAQFPVRPGGGGIGGGAAFGQSGPTVSPYINLLRGGGTTASNYYGIVKPEFQVQQQVQGLSDQQNLNSASIGGLENVPTTGSAIRFMNTQPYFQSLNRGGGNGGGGFGIAQGVAANPIGRNGGAINSNSPFSTSGLNGGGGGRGATR